MKSKQMQIFHVSVNILSLLGLKNGYQVFFLIDTSLFFQYLDFPNPRFFELFWHTHGSKIHN